MLFEGMKRSIVTYTRIPLKMTWDKDKAHTTPVSFLPFIGLLIAVLSSWPLFIPAFDLSLVALFMLLTCVLLTGAFHEDGFMDSLDGLIGGTDPKQRLTIMKDSRLGSYATIGIWFLLAMKWLLLTKLLSLFDSPYMIILLWSGVHILARMTPIFIMQKFSYVSVGQSKAKEMIGQLSLSEWVLVFLPMLSLSLITLYGYAWYLGVFLCVLPALLSWLFGHYFYAKIQGFNGDTLGASEQMSELILLFFFVMYFSSLS